MTLEDGKKPYIIEYQFNYGMQNDLIEETIRLRESFISVVSRIGGLLAFFKVSAVLYIIHNYLYERATVREISLQ